MRANLALRISEKADSQDICFVPSGHYTDMIERLIPGASVPGEIVHVNGRVLGRHDGVVHYTIGQRRGIGVAAAEALYVVALDAANARVIVGPRSALAVTRLRLRDVNWIGGGELADLPANGLPIAARVRSTRPPAPALLMPDRRDRVHRARKRRVARPSLRFLRVPPTRTRGCSGADSSPLPDD